MNSPIPVVQMANEAYTIAVGNGVKHEIALAFARQYGDSHCLGHVFSDEEIMSGKCACEGCTSKRMKRVMV